MWSPARSASRARSAPRQAEDGIDALRQECDTLIVIPNDRLLQISERNVSVMDAFRSADQVLLSGVQGITDLITTPGLINLDFADVKSVMSGAGSALMGIGSARGDNRARQAAEIAIASPLLEASMEGAHGVLLSIYGGSDLGLFEINEAASLVAEAAHPEANIIFGAVIDDTLGDEVRVTVIAAGFDSGQLPYKKVDIRREPAAAARQQQYAGGGRGSEHSARRAAGAATARRGAHTGQSRRRPRRPGLPQVLTRHMADERTAELVGSLAAVRARIADACESVGRDPRAVTLIAVTKTYPASDVAALAQLGVHDLGESKDQEARTKAAELAGTHPQLRWHLVGRLQTNKAKQRRRLRARRALGRSCEARPRACRRGRQAGTPRSARGIRPGQPRR